MNSLHAKTLNFHCSPRIILEKLQELDYSCSKRWHREVNTQKEIWNWVVDKVNFKRHFFSENDHNVFNIVGLLEKKVIFV